MSEQKERTIKELRSGLAQLVSKYQVALEQGQSQYAAEMKRYIEDIIKLKDLDSRIVYSYSEGKTVPIKLNIAELKDLL
ncbi:hypothetical protein ACFL27_08560 [candidate division CSSED10-310 bacterium]|uniref:Uncharacterized protein n=1 Tax=candidate division CSSED10-310 bacterium TaxID=2855610 RepID=A0ABV6YVZ1_UNCC1